MFVKSSMYMMWTVEQWYLLSRLRAKGHLMIYTSIEFPYFRYFYQWSNLNWLWGQILEVKLSLQMVFSGVNFLQKGHNFQMSKYQLIVTDGLSQEIRYYATFCWRIDLYHCKIWKQMFFYFYRPRTEYDGRLCFYRCLSVTSA